MSLLFVAGAALALFLAASGLQSTGRTMLVSQSVSPESWMRTCAYAAPEGVRTLAVDAAEACPAEPPAAAGVRMQARLAD